MGPLVNDIDEKKVMKFKLAWAEMGFYNHYHSKDRYSRTSLDPK